MDEEKTISSAELERLLQYRRRQEAMERLRELSPLPSDKAQPLGSTPRPAGRILPNRRRTAPACPPAVAPPVVATATPHSPLAAAEDWLRGARPQLRPPQPKRRPAGRPPHPAWVAARKGLSWLVDALIYLALLLFILALAFLIYDNFLRRHFERDKQPVVQAEGAPWPVQGWLSSPQEEIKPQAPLPFVALSDTLTLRDPYVPAPTPAPGTAAPTRLVIPSIQLDTPVVEVTIVDGVWETAAYAAGYHRGTARPGTVGNTVISGHKGLDGAVFMRLEEVDIGDEVLLQAGQRLYRYVVAEKKSVWPQQVEVMAQTSRPILTLITCTAFDTQRLVVVAYYDREIVSAGGDVP